MSNINKRTILHSNDLHGEFLAEEMDDADVVIRYSGEAFDPLGTDNALSLMLAQKATDNILYSYDAQQALTNRVDAQIRR